MKDLIDNYELDFLYFDGCVPFQGDDRGQTGLDVIAHFYNRTMRRHNGKQEGVLTIKNRKNHGIYIDGIGTLDLEKDRAEELMDRPWQTDTSIGPWGYNAGAEYRSANDIIDELVDIGSKNGNMLLNVPPKADGTLDAETERILVDIGKWFDVNGEAIYGTRPWFKYGEGKLRFTRKGSVLYVIALEWPDTNVLTVPWSALGEEAGSVSGVSLFGHEGKLQSRRDEKGLVITLPEKTPCEHAWCLRVVLDEPKR